MSKVVIASACRTAMGKFQGSLSNIKATDLGTVVVKEAVRRAKINPEWVDEVIMGVVLQAGLGQNPARQALIHAGIPNAVSATTINKVCGSGLKSVMLAAQAIKAGDAKCIIAGGMENMSQAPYMLRKARNGFRMGHGNMEDLMVADGLWDVYNDFHMGNTAELVSQEYGITREEQDAYALASQKKANQAQKDGKFLKEIVGVEVKNRKNSFVFNTDEGIRHDASLEGFAKLRPAFVKEGGSVTAGNASTINDGASALVVCCSDFAKDKQLPVLAEIKSYATGGMAPEWVMMAPVPAIQAALEKASLSTDQIDLFEINEAFAAASIAIGRKLDLDMRKVNVNGGAIALGHPIGASGARILTTLIHAMDESSSKFGLAGLCLGGGNAVAMVIEKS
tara:strand:- start:1061 stop:2242 length:1182 start_codon:yes stop_codon:yes gene_type:complete